VSEILVAKIGGSTLGSHDTTLEDIAALGRRGMQCVVVHGGGALISDWLKRLDMPTRFERGLRVTDEEGLEVVVAVLAGLVNKQLVAALSRLGARAFGLSGADGAILRARVAGPALGLVGEITGVDAGPLARLLDEGLAPVLAPVAAEWDGGPTGRLLNTNADTAAGAVAAALGARRLAFLTDVPGVKDGDGSVIGRLTTAHASRLIQSGVIEGGMIPKVEACVTAAAAGCAGVIVDGRREHALLAVVEGAPTGTAVA
jgi:acetylglutamate kinase